MNDKLFNAVLNFILKNLECEDDSVCFYSIGWSWFDRIFKDTEVIIRLREEKRYPLVNPFPEFFPDDSCAKAPDLTKITKTYTIYIAYKGETVLQDEISESVYSKLIHTLNEIKNINKEPKLIRISNEIKNINKESTLTDFIKQYDG